MFDDIKYLIEKTTLPESIKISLSVIIRAITWLIWAFVGVGLLLDSKYFIYWIAFFIFIEGMLFIALIFVLIQSIKYETGKNETREIKTPTKNTLRDGIIKGVLGNVFFYLLFLIFFIILKAMGIIDNFMELIFQTVA